MIADYGAKASVVGKASTARFTERCRRRESIAAGEDEATMAYPWKMVRFESVHKHTPRRSLVDRVDPWAGYYRLGRNAPYVFARQDGKNHGQVLRETLQEITDRILTTLTTVFTVS